VLVRQGLKILPGKNTLAHYENLYITDKKISGPNLINLFVYNLQFFEYARMFVRLELKSLPGTGTLAFYKNSLITDKKNSGHNVTNFFCP
jgi:hypothetical protein